MLKRKLLINKTGVTTRITIVIILVAAITAISSGLIAYIISKSQFSSYVDKGGYFMAQRYAQIVTSYYQQHNDLDGLHITSHEDAPYSKSHVSKTSPSEWSVSLQRRVVIVNKSGQVVVDSDGKLIGKNINPTGKDYLKYPVYLDNRDNIATIYIYNPLKQGMESLENKYLTNIRQKIADSVALFCLLALLVGLLLARRITQPINDLSSAIHEVARGNLEIRADSIGDREFIQLANDFNHMAEQLSAHEQQRNSLVSNIAHELRTPLSIMRGNLEAIQVGSMEMTDAMRSSLVDEIIRLTRLVKDLETVGLAEAGALVLNLETITTNDLLDSILPLRLSMEEDHIDFQVFIDPELTTFLADRLRLTQILINLLSNAICHVDAEKGIIELTIKPEGDYVEIAVKNNGAGISEKDIPHLFERFYRVDQSRNRGIGGTGLGLAIARSYVEAHGGKIWVESQPGQGATFYFNLPKMTTRPSII